MADVTIPQKEYQALRKQAAAFKLFASRFFEATLGSAKDVVDDFRNMDLYSEDFLNDLESGLEKSSYSKGYEDTATKKRSTRVSHSA